MPVGSETKIQRQRNVIDHTMNTIHTIALIGKGNVAMALGLAWEKQGIHIAAFCNREGILPKGFAGNDTLLLKDPARIPYRVDAILVATSDDAVMGTIDQLPTGPLVIHFSGSLPTPDAHAAVLWPIQSIVPGKIHSATNFPIAVTCASSLTRSVMAFAGLVATDVRQFTEVERQTAHLAAVFAANFTNHCFAIAQRLCANAGLSWELFQPIAQQIANQGIRGNSATHQTGPAIREDQMVIDAHEALLDEHPDFKTIYTALSKSIQSFPNS